MLTRNDLLQNRDLFLKKSQGCMIGLAVGDAMGDLGRSQEHRAQYGIVTNLYPGAQSTDDTEFGYLTARALIDNKGEITSALVAQAWRTYVLDQGGIFERAGKPLYGAAKNLERGLEPPYSGIDNVQNNDDGAAMRMAPIGVYCAGDPDKAAELAAEDARVSHHMDGIWAAQAVAAGIAMAMIDAETETIISTSRSYIPDDSWLARTFDHTMDLCDKADCMEDVWEDIHTDLWTPSHSTSAEAIPQVYAILRMTDCDWKNGMFWATNFGRDADSIAAIVGSMCGAKQSIDIVPDRWVQQVRQAAGVSLKFAANEDALNLAESIVNLAFETR